MLNYQLVEFVSIKNYHTALMMSFDVISLKCCDLYNFSFLARSPVFNAMFEHSMMEESRKVCV